MAWSTAPHHGAAQAGLGVLRDGGNAVEAAVAVAATLAVVYPHMTGIGGDGFWLIAEPDGAYMRSHGCGGAAAKADLALYARARNRAHARAAGGEYRGRHDFGLGAALEQAAASCRSRDCCASDRAMPKPAWRLRAGGAAIAAAKGGELRDQPGAYGAIFEPDDRPLREGEMLRQPRLAQTLRRLAARGLDGFLTRRAGRADRRGSGGAGQPGRPADLAAHRHPARAAARGDCRRAALQQRAANAGRRLAADPGAVRPAAAPRQSDGFDHRPRPGRGDQAGVPAARPPCRRSRLSRLRLRRALLDDPAALAQLAGAHRSRRGRCPGRSRRNGAIPAGSASPMARAGWSARSSRPISSSAPGWCCRRPASPGRIAAAASGWPRTAGTRCGRGRKPFHTLNPALALLRRWPDHGLWHDGRRGPAADAGGAVHPLCPLSAADLQEAINRPRWLLGRTWGDESTTLKIEDGFAETVYAALSRRRPRCRADRAVDGDDGPCRRDRPPRRTGCWKAPPIRAATAGWRHGKQAAHARWRDATQLGVAPFSDMAGRAVPRLADPRLSPPRRSQLAAWMARGRHERVASDGAGQSDRAL